MDTEDTANRGFYKQLFELSADAHLIIENSRFVDCNQATVKMLGYEHKHQVLNTHPSQLSPPFQPDGSPSDEEADRMMAIAREKGSHRFVWEHIRASGEIFPVEVLLTALVSNQGKEQLHTVWRDITDRRKREMELAKSESRFRSYVENAPLAIIISNREGQILEINSAALAMSGYSLDQIRNMKASTWLSPQNLAQVQTHLKKVSHDKKVEEDVLYLDPYGHERIWHVNSVLLDGDKFISFALDTTERHRIGNLQELLKDCANDLLNTLSPEEMAKVAAQYLRSYFKSDALGVWYGNDEEKKDYSLYLEDTPPGETVPQEYPQEIYPYTPGFDSSLPERTFAHLKNRTSDELASAGAVATVSARDRISASIIFAPLMWEAKRIGVISVHSYTLNYFSEKDLVDLGMFATLIGSALERAFVYKQLHESLEEKEVLLQEIQHRTRNNMNVIISLLNMQANEAKNEQLSHEFKVIENRIYAMSIAYNKLQVGTSLHLIDLRAYLLTLASGLYHSAGLTGERVTLSFECEDVFVHLEVAVPIGLIFNEMMSNAVTHAFPNKSQGTIWIKLTRLEDERIRLTVKDNGVGMTQEDRAKAKSSMGFRIIEMLSTDQLRGSYSFSSDKGCEHVLELDS